MTKEKFYIYFFETYGHKNCEGRNSNVELLWKYLENDTIQLLQSLFPPSTTSWWLKVQSYHSKAHDSFIKCFCEVTSEINIKFKIRKKLVSLQSLLYRMYMWKNMFHCLTLSNFNNSHCVKSIQIRSFFWFVISCIRSYFPVSVFGHISCSVS